MTSDAVSIYTSIEGTSPLPFLVAPEDEKNVLQTIGGARF